MTTMQAQRPSRCDSVPCRPYRAWGMQRAQARMQGCDRLQELGPKLGAACLSACSGKSAARPVVVDGPKGGAALEAHGRAGVLCDRA